MSYKINQFTGLPDYFEETDLSGYVPYTGATDDLDLGTHSITAGYGSFVNGNLQILDVPGLGGGGLLAYNPQNDTYTVIGSLANADPFVEITGFFGFLSNTNSIISGMYDDGSVAYANGNFLVSTSGELSANADAGARFRVSGVAPGTTGEVIFQVGSAGGEMTSIDSSAVERIIMNSDGYTLYDSFGDNSMILDSDTGAMKGRSLWLFDNAGGDYEEILTYNDGEGTLTGSNWTINGGLSVTGGIGTSSISMTDASAYIRAIATSGGSLELRGYDNGAIVYNTMIKIQNVASGGAKMGFFNATPINKPTVSGSRGGNAALASLCTQLANLGLITDSTS